jgi:hypothetical protein
MLPVALVGGLACCCSPIPTLGGKGEGGAEGQCQERGTLAAQ